MDDNKIYGVTDLIATLLCFALGYVFIKFVLFNPITLYTMFFNFIFLGIAAFYIKKSSKKITLPHIALFGIAVVFNCIYAVSSNPLISFIGGAFATLIGAYTLFISVNRFSAFGNSFVVDFLRSIFTVPFGGFGECFCVVSYFAKKKKSSKKIGHIIIGLIIGIPVTVICGTLLVNADDSFGKLMNNFLDFGIEEAWTFAVQLVFGIPVAAYLFGMLFSNVKKSHPPSSEELPPTHFVPVSIACSAVAPVCLLYAVFFISHFSYLTSALSGTLLNGFSYAEYARQGFFELCMVAFINLGIIILLNSFDKREENNGETIIAKSVKFFTLFIAFSTVILIVTALGKMFLYIERYGLSPLRVYTSWFMVLLLIFFVIIAIRIFVTKLKIFRALFAVFAVMLGLLCFGDVEGMIAKYNINAYTNGKLDELDVQLLYGLSDSAVKYAIPLAEDERYGDEIHEYLENRRKELDKLTFEQYSYESIQARNRLISFS